MKPRTLPNPAPEHIEFDSRMVVKRLRQSDDMVLYSNYINDEPTFIVLMASFDPGTALTVQGFLDNRRALVVADRDGVVKTSEFLNTPDKKDAKKVMIPSALAASRKLNEAGVGLAIATNQGGYQSDEMSFVDTIATNVRVSQQLADAGGHLDAVFICPFAVGLQNPPPDVIDARKPAGGMPLYAKHLAAVSATPVLAMIGDQRTDGAAGQAAGLKFFAVTDKNGRWEAELEAAMRKHEELPTLDTDPCVYREVPAFADAVGILLKDKQ